MVMGVETVGHIPFTIRKQREMNEHCSACFLLILGVVETGVRLMDRNLQFAAILLILTPYNIVLKGICVAMPGFCHECWRYKFKSFVFAQQTLSLTESSPRASIFFLNP